MVDMPKVVVNISVKAEIEQPRRFSLETFLMVAEQNPFREPQKPTDGGKKKKKKKTKPSY